MLIVSMASSTHDAEINASTVKHHALLKDRAIQLFDGLRDLPQYGQGLWESYFRRTFDAYNSLWKYQQDHRVLLEQHGGLRRHQIGEVASRIGQLYYLFYLRKGDTAYLDEAFVFYDFIRRRRYFAAAQQGGPATGGAEGVTPPPLGAVEVRQLALRELRYYARFAVVCFLTGRRAVLHELLNELRERVAAYPVQGADAAAPPAAHLLASPDPTPATPRPAAGAAGGGGEWGRSSWELVLSEFSEFLRVERPFAIGVLAGGAPPVVGLSGAMASLTMSGGGGDMQASANTADEGLPLRLQPQLTHPLGAIVGGFGPMPSPPLSLAQCVMVGAKAAQLRVSELALDVFRALHTVEWDAAARRIALTEANQMQTPDALGALGESGGGKPTQYATPHKYLLHRPAVSQLLLVLGTMLVELNPLQCALLYLSADGLHAPQTDSWAAAPAHQQRQSQASPSSSSSSSVVAPHQPLAADATSTSAPSSADITSTTSSTATVVTNSTPVDISDLSAPSPHKSGGVALAVTSEDDEAAFRSCAFGPTDLLPFCRMPLVLVVDSDNAHAFASLRDLAASYAKPLLCLLSPSPATPHCKAARQATELAGGGALTLFLHEPLTAICAMCNVKTVTREACAAAEEAIAEASHALTRRLMQQLKNGNGGEKASHAEKHHPALLFMADPFLRQLLIRFILCTAAYDAHKPTRELLKSRELLPPRSTPPLPTAILRHAAALSAVRAIATAIGAATSFHESFS